MNHLEKKETKIIEKIVATVTNLEQELTKLDDLSSDPNKKHHFKKWIAEKKALHEIKKILHEEKKLEKYDE
ncbi:hypothetical protein LWX64_002647, partial [Enterococcus faecalis]|nr:hypothetical protein [Enterococcus faecalis]